LIDYVGAFVVGGLLCVAAQLVVNLTPLTPAHTMVLFVSLGAIFSGFGLYEVLIDFGGAGALVPLTGFGHSLVTGIVDGLNQEGFIGLFKGGITATSMGITVAVVSGYCVALLFNPKG